MNPKTQNITIYVDHTVLVDISCSAMMPEFQKFIKEKKEQGIPIIIQWDNTLSLL